MKALAVSSLIILLSLPANAQIVVGGAAQQQGQTSINNTEFNGVRQKNVAGARAYAPRPTSDCMGTFAAGIQSPYAGFSFGGSKHAVPCNDRENAESVASLGMYDMAQRMRIITVCEDKRYKYLEECIALDLYNKSVIKLIKASNQENKIVENKACEYPTKPECEKSKRFK